MLKHKVLFVGIAFSSILAHAQVGSCGDDLEWSISGTTLTISGSGDMTDYTTIGSTTTTKKPSWDPYKDIIESVVVCEGVTSIGGFAFYDYQNLKSISLPEGLTTIGPLAFYNCDGLTSITFPETLTTFAGYRYGSSLSYSFYTCGAFNDCDGLTEITIPTNVEYIGGNAFYNCKNLETVYWNVKSCTLAAHGATSGTRNQASQIFQGCPIQNVHFGSSVIHVPTKLFNTNALQKVTTSGSIEIIDYEALNKSSQWFADFSADKDLVIIDKAVYHYATEQASAFAVEIPEGVKSIGEEVFKNQTKLVKLTIPESFNHMGYNSFSGCTALSEVVWNAKECTFETAPFSDALYRITLGDNVVTLGVDMLKGCSGLKSLTLPSLLERIDDYAIYGCDGIKELTIPDNVSYVGLLSASNMEKISIGESVDTIIGIWSNSLSEVYFNAKNVSKMTNFSYDLTCEKVVFGDAVEQIPGSVFYRSTINNIQFGSSLKEITTLAFQYCTFKNIYFPEGLENIAYKAFSNSTSSTLYIPGTVKSIDSSLSDGVKDMIIHANDSALVVKNNGTYPLYVADRDKYLDSSVNTNYRWSNAPDRVFSMVDIEGYDEPLSFVYTGRVPEFGDISIKCNIPGYEAELVTEKLPTQPGRYEKILLHMSGDHEFDVEVPFEYVITTDEAAEQMRSKLNELIQEVNEFATSEMFLDADADAAGWYDVELTAEHFDSNAKRLTTDSSDPFTTWDVLIDGNVSTYFHSDWGGRETTDGLDHYLQVDLDELINMFRFSYTTRASSTIAAPTHIIVYGSSDKENWKILSEIDSELPTTYSTQYTSLPISSIQPIRSIRLMVTSSTSSKDKFGHSFFVFSEFGLEAAIVYYKISLENISEADLKEFNEALIAAKTMVQREFTTAELLQEAYDRLESAYSVILNSMGMTGLSKCESSNSEYDATEIFDLSGRRHYRISTPGIYIVNGKAKFLR